MYSEKELCYENTENSPSVIKKSLMTCLTDAMLTSFHGHLSSWQPASGVHRFPAAIRTWCSDVTGDREREHTSHRDSLFLSKSTLASCSSAVPQLSVTNALLVSTHTDTNNLAILWQSAFTLACWVQLNSNTHTCEHIIVMGELIFIIYDRNAPIRIFAADTDYRLLIRYRSQLFQLICKLSVDCHCWPLTPWRHF